MHAARIYRLLIYTTFQRKSQIFALMSLLLYYNICDILHKAVNAYPGASISSLSLPGGSSCKCAYL